MIAKLVLLLACICTFIHAVSVECPDGTKAKKATQAIMAAQIATSGDAIGINQIAK